MIRILFASVWSNRAILKWLKYQLHILSCLNFLKPWMANPSLCLLFIMLKFCRVLSQKAFLLSLHACSPPTPSSDRSGVLKWLCKRRQNWFYYNVRGETIETLLDKTLSMSISDLQLTKWCKWAQRKCKARIRETGAVSFRQGETSHWNAYLFFYNAKVK